MTKRLIQTMVAVLAVCAFAAPDGSDAADRKRLRRPGERSPPQVAPQSVPLLITDENVADPDRLNRPTAAPTTPVRVGERLRDNQARTGRGGYRQAGERVNKRVLGRIETRVEARIGPRELPTTRTTDGTAARQRTTVLPSPDGSR